MGQLFTDQFQALPAGLSFLLQSVGRVSHSSEYLYITFPMLQGQACSSCFFFSLVSHPDTSHTLRGRSTCSQGENVKGFTLIETHKVNANFATNTKNYPKKMFIKIYSRGSVVTFLSFDHHTVSQTFVIIDHTLIFITLHCSQI